MIALEKAIPSDRFTFTRQALRPVPHDLKPFASPSVRKGNASLNENLIAVAEKQDRAAFADLYAYFAPRIKAFMLKRGCDLTTAE